MSWIRLLAVALFCLAGVPALAQEHERPRQAVHSGEQNAADSHTSATGEESGEDHGGGPKYELLTIDGMTALWTIVVFLVLLTVLRRAAWKPIQKVLTEREKFIADSLEQAKRIVSRPKRGSRNTLKSWKPPVRRRPPSWRRAVATPRW